MKVYQAINQVQREIGKTGIAKDQKTKGNASYKFRGIDDVYNALAPIIAEAGLVIIPRVLESTHREEISKSGNKLFYKTLKVAFDLVAAEDGSKHTAVTEGEAMDSGDKATNKAMSAAYKYMCFQTFSIPTEGDNDADATTHEVQHADVENLVANAKDALEHGDWLTLCQLDKSGGEPWIAAWSKLGSKDKSAIKLLQEVKNEYRDKLNILAGDEDEMGFRQLNDELKVEEARFICSVLDEKAKELMIRLQQEKKAA